jgi:fatty acid desaturase
MSHFSKLRDLIRQAQLLKKQPAYYARVVLGDLTMLVLSIALLFRLSNPVAQVINAAFLAFVFTQLSFLVHDAGHGAIFDVRWKNLLVGRFDAGLLLGMSFSYWCEDHNRHHRHPNQVAHDPSVNVPVLAFSEEQARSKRGVCRFTAKYQAWLFFPMAMLESLNKRRGVLKFLLRHRHSAELALFACHYVLYFGVLVWALPVPRAILFSIVHQGLYGLYMSLVFAPNHKGMPLLSRNSSLTFLESQTATARNVRIHRRFDFLFGGLNYQIEHHLFPRIPRNKLPEARSIIRQFCLGNGIPYRETGFVETYRDILRHLRIVSRVLNKPRG